MSFGKLWGKIFYLAAAILLASVGGAPAQTTLRTLLPGHRPEVVSHLQPLGRLEGSSQLKLSINLPLHNRDALTNLLAQLYDPASPQYHHYLTPDEFNARFGPTADDYSAVSAWAIRNGFTITGLHPDRMLLEASAPVSDIEHALQVTLRTYAHPTESRTFFAPDAEPSVDAGLPIAYIGGLDNFARPHPKNLRRARLKPTAQATPRMGSGPNGNLAGFDYRAVYAPGVTLTGAGQQIGLLEFDGYYANDIASYRSQTGVPNVPLQNVLLDGFNGRPTRGADSGNAEVALDIEMAISMAPGLAKVVVYESNTNGFPSAMLEAMSTNTAIKQFSCSWDFGGLTAAQQSAMDTYFQKFDLQGQSFFDAAGDNGATNAVNEAPSDDPYITQVGGTTLATTGPGGSWQSEVVWNAGEGPGLAGSSGGVSATYPIPAWQTGVKMSANQGSTSHRNFPDVAAVADNVFLVADNGYEETTGGTSAATPLWAGFAALANQQAAAMGGATNSIGFINPALYRIGTGSGYTACFNDITAGNNTNFNASQYLAAPGYDLCTGWGSPAGGSLINALTGTDGLQITPGQDAVASGPIGGPFTMTNLTLALANLGKPAFNWTLGSTSAWLTASSSSGTLSSNGTASVNITLNSAANQLPAGVYSAGLWFTNLTSGLVQFRQFTLQVGQELVQDGGFEAGDFSYWTLTGNASVYANDFVDTANGFSGYSPNAGNYFAALGQSGSLASISQSLPTVAGQTYRVSFWLQNPAINSFPNQFEVQWNSSSASPTTILNRYNPLGASAWSNYVFVVKATSSITSLRFASETSAGYFGLDGVSVIPTNLPAPVLNWTNPAAITYGTALSAKQLDASTSVPGKFAYLPAAGKVLNTGTNLLTVVFTPTDSQDYGNATGTVSLVVLAATPVINWTNPAAITYGTALGSKQLNASANAPGTFAYSPPAGSVTGAGSNVLTLVFTPASPTNYYSVTNSVNLVVLPANPVIRWTNPAAITYGAALNGAQLDASANVAGGFTYTPASGTVLNAGTNKLTLTFAPADTVDYNSVTDLVSLVVRKAAPVVDWTNPPALTYGTALSAAQLDASANVPGAFTYNPGTNTVLNAGTNKLTAVFTPTDTVDYGSATNSVSQVVLKATPVINWTNPAAINYGTTLSTAQLNASASVPGTFAYSPAAGKLLNAGTNLLTEAFTPANKVDYNSITSSVSLIVFPAEPLITWTNPAAIVYGAALGGKQLNASANVAGAFAYTPATGTVLSAGTNVLTAAFTPTSKTNYYSVTNSVSLVVLRATPVLTWTNPAAITYGTALTATQLDARANVSGEFAYTPPAGSVLNAGTNQLTTTFTPADMVDYNRTNSLVKLVVRKATPVVVWTNPAAIYYSAALSSLQLNASANVSGSFVYTPTAGTVPSAGTNKLTAAFTPADMVDYLSTTSSVSLIVFKLAPYIIWTNPAAITYGTALGSTQLNASANIPGVFTYTPAAGRVLTAGTNALTAAFTPANKVDFYSITNSVSLIVYPAVPVITWTNPAAITYGTALSTKQLNAHASVPGILAYTPAAGTKLSAGTNILTVGFSPTDKVDYTSITDSVNLFVLSPVTANLKAVVLPSSVILGLQLAGTTLIFNALNGIAGETYVLCTSTNLALPFNQWTPVATNVPAASGSFSLTLTNAASLPAPQAFYLLMKQ